MIVAIIFAIVIAASGIAFAVNRQYCSIVEAFPPQVHLHVALTGDAAAYGDKKPTLDRLAVACHYAERVAHWGKVVLSVLVVIAAAKVLG